MLKPGLINFFCTDPSFVQICTDGAIRPQAGISGLGVIVMDRNFQIRDWFSKRVGKMTNNEAEYEAAILGLDRLKIYHPRTVLVYSDSQVMVDQVCGRSAVRDPRLKLCCSKLRELILNYSEVNFIHIPREKNKLADALANYALEGGRI